MPEGGGDGSCQTGRGHHPYPGMVPLQKPLPRGETVVRTVAWPRTRSLRTGLLVTVGVSLGKTRGHPVLELVSPAVRWGSTLLPCKDRVV